MIILLLDKFQTAMEQKKLWNPFLDSREIEKGF